MENRKTELEFHWIPLEKAPELELYPTDCRYLLGKLSAGIQHFVYKE